jgi:RNA polymerase sigma-70 factor (ECF subfamily)
MQENGTIERSSEQELILRYRQGHDLQVLGRLYAPYMELVYGVCLKYLKDAEAAKDAVMNIFEELVEKLKRHEVDNFKSWLYVVAKNHCLMQLRKDGKMKTSEIPETFMQSEEDLHLNGVLEKESNLRIMEDCLGSLPQEQKRSVELFFMEGKCYNEISELTGQEWNKVRSQIQNGKRNLKICMEKKIKEIR